ncbi:MAG TPA: hypothetical protein VFN87_22140 [Solirubrobacteraceae bacterium]|nr:hypothetical protein [Solirubrobacteraceae bacterium]
MDDEGLASWREVRRARPLNERRMAMYDRLMEAEARLEDVRRRRGVSDTALGDAIESSEAEEAASGEGTVYLSALSRYVAALGGRLDIIAVFGDEAVPMPGLPDPPADAG